MKSFNILSSVTFLVAILAFASCKKEETKVIAPLTIPTTYESANYSANIVAQATLNKNFTKMLDEVKKGKIAGKLVSKDSLNYWFTQGTPSVKSISTSFHVAKIENWFLESEKASGNTYILSSSPEGNGGLYGSYLLNKYGLETKEAMEKATFGSFYKYAVELLSGNITLTTVDQVVAIFGANPTFPNTATTSKTSKPDVFMANYASRRDKNDGSGFYSQMKNAFLKLQAAVKAGADYNKERDEAIAAIKLTWEKAAAATTINYCHGLISTLSNTSLTDAQKASALHNYAEGVGFLTSWKSIEQKHKKITEAQIDEILELFYAPANGTPSSYKFVMNPASELARVTQVITKLQAIYGFTDQEIIDFKKNWINEQGR